MPYRQKGSPYWYVSLTSRSVPRLIADGWRQVNLLLPPEAVARMERMAAGYPGKAALVTEALRRFEERA